MKPFGTVEGSNTTTTSKRPEEERFNLGNFQLMRDDDGSPLMIGKGTFGRTYKARHRFLDTVVALKVINERYASDPVIRHRFLAEGKAVARLSHPHIARIYDFGESGGALYYAMEFCSGGNLADYTLKHGAFDVPLLINVAMQVAGALDCAHQAGFVHRDIKPSNIMSTVSNPPLCTKLIDFGLVHATGPEGVPKLGEEESEGRFIGTPLFASPEQLREEAVDARSDLFSLGVTLWYLAAGGAPEKGSSAEIAASRLNPESYATKLPRNLPEPLRLLLAELLEKDPSRRISSVRQALAGLRQCAESLGLETAAEFRAAPPEIGDTGIPALSRQVEETPPAELEVHSGPIESEFTHLVRLTEANTGTYYSAESVASPVAAAAETAVILHVNQPRLSASDLLIKKMCANIGSIRGLRLATVIRPDSFRQYTNGTVVVMNQPGANLLTALRAQGIVALSQARTLLEGVASAADQMQSAGLPGVDLRPASIFLDYPESSASGPRNIADARPRLLPSFLRLQETAEVSESGDAPDASSTMTADSFAEADRESDPCRQFAALIYRIASGRNCHAAAWLSPQAFIVVPGLSERANRLLSLVIARQATCGSCEELLRELIGLEGISGGMTRSRISTDSSKVVLTATRSAPRIEPTHSTVRQLGTGTVASSVARSAFATTPGRAAREAPAQPVATRVRPKVSLWFFVAVAAVLLVLASTFFWRSGLQKQRSQNLPDSFAIRLQDDPEIQPAFTIANTPVSATQAAGEWILPLNGIHAKLPIVVRVEAFGYDPNEFAIHSADELFKGIQLSMNRSRGKIAFVGIPPEYTQASCLMREALPEDKGHVDVPKYPTGYELHGDATAPLDLPTGIYLVNLKGKSAPQRWPIIATVRPHVDISVRLPPAVEGRYIGTLSSSSLLRLEIKATVQGHPGSWIQQGSERQTLVEGRLNPAEQTFVARALASTADGVNLHERVLKMRPAGSDSYDVFAASADGSEVPSFALLGTVRKVVDSAATDR